MKIIDVHYTILRIMYIYGANAVHKNAVGPMAYIKCSTQNAVGLHENAERKNAVHKAQ